MKAQQALSIFIAVLLLAACQPGAAFPGASEHSAQSEVQAGTPAATFVSPAQPALDYALQNLVSAAERLNGTNQVEEADTLRQVVREAMPEAQAAAGGLELALDQLDGEAAEAVRTALRELTSALQLAEALENGGDQQAIQWREELLLHGAAALNAIYQAMELTGAAPRLPGSDEKLAGSDLEELGGNLAEVLVDNLNFPAAIVVGPNGSVYVAEAGYANGNLYTPARLLRVGDTGDVEVIAEDFAVPLTGLALHENMLFASHGGTITRLDLETGSREDILTGMPAQGDHFTAEIAIGPEGTLYFTQGAATETGVVGLDNYLTGWLQLSPNVHDIPCRDLKLNGTNFTTSNPLTLEVVTDLTETGPFLPFGQPATPGQVIKGQLKCNGAVLRVNLDGTDLEVVADGFHDPYGLGFHPDGRLFVTENGPQGRGSRPVSGPDSLYAVEQGGWYGWPDFYGGVPVGELTRLASTWSKVLPVLEDSPPLAGQPLANLGLSTRSAGFDFSPGDLFGEAGSLYIAQFGALPAFTTTPAETLGGQKVVLIRPNGEMLDFLTGPEFFHPVDAKFSQDGKALYVVHFGAVSVLPGGLEPVPGTGALIRITP